MMASYISADKIEEIRSAADIVEIVSNYVTLKQRGKNYFGLCPFHPEKTPSFSVNPEKQIFHCFGCGVGGNVIAFIMKIENLQFPEAVKFLADKLGITIPEIASGGERSKERLTLFKVNKFAAEYFQHNLLNTNAGKPALEYLQQRGFSEEIIHKFQLGFAPDFWDGLLRAAQKQNISAEWLYKVGLVIPKGQGGYYDRFRGRVIFPIHNLAGMVVGFGGRILQVEVEAPKYINSPETPVYQKGRILYGLFQNKEAVREHDQVILVEGYADLLSLVQFGVDNVVATSGTALTAEQARVILRYTRNVVILYDGDIAGALAAMRGVDVLLAEGLQVKVVMLPQEHDPDTFVRQQGKEELLKLIANAQDFIDFKITAFTAEKALDSPQRKAELVRILTETIAQIKDEVMRNFYIKDVAEKLDVEEAVIHREMARIFRRRSTQTVKESLPPVSNARLKAEQGLIEILIRFQNMIPPVYHHLELEEICDHKNRELLSLIFQHYTAHGRVNPQHLMDYIDDGEMLNLLANILAKDEEPNFDVRRWAEDCVRTIKIGNIQQQINQIRQQMKQTETKAEEMANLNAEYIRLKQLQMNLKKQRLFEEQ